MCFWVCSRPKSASAAHFSGCLGPKSGLWGRFFFTAHLTCCASYLSSIKQYAKHLLSHLLFYHAIIHPALFFSSTPYSKQLSTYFSHYPITINRINMFMDITSRYNQKQKTPTFYTIDHGLKLFRVIWSYLWAYSKALSCYRLCVLIAINKTTE